MSYQVMKRHGGTLNAYCKGKKVVCKGYMLYDSNYMTFWKRENYRHNKKICDTQGSEGRKR